MTIASPRWRTVTTSVRVAIWLSGALVGGLFVGCGDGRPTVYPVSGVVLIDGQPVTKGTIRVMPKDMRSAHGTIGEDGRFTLTTFEKGDGCYPGVHAVVVNGFEWLSETTRRWYVPKKYADAETSGLTATIDGPTDSLTIELTWDGKPEPFIETHE